MSGRRHERAVSRFCQTLHNLSNQTATVKEVKWNLIEILRSQILDAQEAGDEAAEQRARAQLAKDTLVDDELSDWP